MDALGSAILADDIAAEESVTTFVSRDAIAAALADGSDGAELALDHVEHGREEHGTVGIDWSREDLELLLGRTTDDRVALTFDRRQLSAALADVEAHGLRERALVFAVVATGALGAGSGIAGAAIDAAGGGATAATPAIVTDVSSTGGYAAPTAAAGADQVTDASTGGYGVAPAAADSTLTDASSGGYGIAQAAADSTVTDVSSGGGYEAPAAPADGGFTLQAPSPTDGLIVGGVALAIAAAAFGARRQRMPRPA